MELRLNFTNMHDIPTSSEIHSLFANSDPDIVWAKATSIIGRTSPDYDLTFLRSVFNDVLRLFNGEYPGYSPIKTLYHDRPHTLDVFLCALRLIHGAHVSGIHHSDDQITLVLTATLLHDIGYVQQQGAECGTGAQYTQTHVRRGITFMRAYLAERNYPATMADMLEPIMLSTDPAQNFLQIDFPDEATRMLSKIVGTADLTGQMADRTYLEKLLFLYLEFREAHVGNYQSTYDMLCQTKVFYQATLEKLDHVYGGIYSYLAAHFKAVMGVERNYYMESIEKNIAYLSKVIALNETEYLSMLKRGGIVEKSKTIPDPS
jgi:hypothetical protein